MEALRKTSLNYGLILGIILIVSTTVCYAIDLELFTKLWYGIAIFIFIVAFGAFSAVSAKKLSGGFLPFKQAFTAFFITVLIGILLSALYTIVLFNFIDTDAKRILSENAIKANIDAMQKFDLPPKAINESVNEMKKLDAFGVMGQLIGLASEIVKYAVVGLITALIVRRERPQSL